MKEIKLLYGEVALVDDEDYELVSQYKWRARKGPHTKYAGTYDRHTKKEVLLHRLIMRPAKGIEVDHINHNGLDNRRENLRLCTRAENARNRIKVTCGISKYKGVRDSRGIKWIAEICYNGKIIYLGSFDVEEWAAEAYNRAAIKYFGEFAQLNEIDMNKPDGMTRNDYLHALDRLRSL